MEINNTSGSLHSILNAALIYFEKGILTIPIKLSDGQPLADYSKFAKQKVNQSDLKKMFENLDFESNGIAIPINSSYGHFEAIRFKCDREEFGLIINEILSVTSLQCLSSEGRIAITRHAEGFDIIYKLPEKGLPPQILAEKVDKVGNRVSYIEIIGNDDYLIVAPTKGYDPEKRYVFPSTISVSDRNLLIELIRLYNHPVKNYMDSMVYGRKENLAQIANEFNATEKSGLIIEYLKEVKWQKLTKNIWAKKISDTDTLYGLIDWAKNDRFSVSSKSEPFEPNTLYKPFDFIALKMNGDYMKAFDAVGSKIPRLNIEELRRYKKTLKNLQDSHVSLLEEYVQPEPYIYTEDNAEKFIIGSVHNLSVLSGKAKVGKTLLLNEITSSAFKDERVFHYSQEISGKKVVYFDTEQSRNHSRMINERIVRLTKRDKEYLVQRFELHNITNRSHSERVDMIEEKLYGDPDIAILIIDGIVDLIGNYNNPCEVSELMTRLLKWKDENLVHIMVVIHENKGNSFLRGHLGTELMNKAETVIGVSKNDDVIKVKCKALRNKEFKTKAFIIIEDGILEPFTGFNNNCDNSIENFTEDEHYDLLSTVFEGVEEMSYDELWSNLKETLQSMYGILVGDNKVKKLITKYVDDGMIQKIRRGFYTFIQPDIE